MVASVTTKGGIPKYAMKNPAKNPANKPIPSATKNASHTGAPKSTTKIADDAPHKATI